MFTAKTYQFPESLDKAYELLQQSRTNTILGGCGWLKMTQKRIGTAIDLSRLGLDRIEEDAQEIRIGAMVTLRQLETHPALRQLFGGVLPESVRRIVGVQFRNCATVGASVWMRAGYSDLLTALLALDARVTLYQGGEQSLAQFIEQPYTRDILTGILLRKDGRQAAYQSLRQSATDFPVLAVCVSRLGEEWRVSIGARPMRAALSQSAAAQLKAGLLEKAGFAAAQELQFGSNLRGSAQYRALLAKVLTERAARQLLEKEAAE